MTNTSNQGVELLAVTQADHKVDIFGVHKAHCYQGDYEGVCKYGDDDCPAASAVTPASSGVLVEALRQIKHSIQQASIPGNDWRRELKLITSLTDQALSTTATPASDGERAFVETIANMAGDELSAHGSPELRDAARKVLADTPGCAEAALTALSRVYAHARFGWLGRDCCQAVERALMHLRDKANPDRFGEGYRAGVEASAKVAEERYAGRGSHPELRAAKGIATAIRAIQPATGDEA